MNEKLQELWIQYKLGEKDNLTKEELDLVMINMKAYFNMISTICDILVSNSKWEITDRKTIDDIREVIWELGKLG